MTQIRLAALFMVLAGASSSIATAGFMRQSIQNTTGGDVNDLTLVINSVPAGLLNLDMPTVAKLWHAGLDTNPPNGANDPDERIKGAGPTAVGNQSTFVWAQNAFGTLVDKAFVDIDFDGTGKIDKDKSMWTLNGVTQGVVTTVGMPMQVALNVKTGEAVAIFENPETTSIGFTNINLYRDNLLVNYNIDDFTNPTGQSVGGLPSFLKLNPGESATLSFGIVDPSLYLLATASVFYTSDPDTMFNLATAVAVPEPTSFAIFGFGALGLVAGRRRSKRAA